MHQKYFLLLSLLTILLMSGFLMSELFLSHFHLHYTWWLLPLLFGLISAGGHSLMTRSVKAAGDQFMIWFLLAISVKMLLYLAVLLIWFVISGKSLGIPFVAAFAINYVAVTILDLVIILRINKNLQDQGKKS